MVARGWLLVLVMGVVSCSDDSGGEARSRGAMVSMDQLAYDCEQTVQCLLAMGQDVGADPVGSCMRSSAAAIDSESAAQAFEANVARCSAFVVCDYYNCVIADGGGFGQAQSDRVQRLCDAEAECALTQPPARRTQQGCVSEVGGWLDAAVEAQRNRWVTVYDGCSGGGCAFTSCFETAWGGPYP